MRGAVKSMQKLDIFDYEKPIGIQIFGGEMEPMMYSAQVVEAHQPELLDINYGCPVKKVVCKDAGAGILKNIPKMMKLTSAVIKSTSLPVTVKTRLGWDAETINIVEVVERLQDIGVQAVTIHARTRVQMYKGEADWAWIAKVKENPRIHIPIFGNGDIDSPEKALRYKNTFGADGLMIGRAAIGYPWIFREIKHYFETGQIMEAPNIHERAEACRQHLQRSVEWKGEGLGIVEMRRHYAQYFKGYEGIKEYRMRLVNTMEKEELYQILEEIEQHYSFAV